MSTARRDPLVDELEALVSDYSIAGVIAGLVRLSGEHKELLKQEGDSGYRDWETLEEAFKRTLDVVSAMTKHDE